MKPCRRNKRRLAWLAAGELEANESEMLQAHLRGCPGCASYWSGMKQVVQRVESLRAPAEAPVSPGFHARLRQRIQAEHTSAGWTLLDELAQFCSRRRRLILLAGFIPVLLYAAVLHLRKEPIEPNPVSVAALPREAPTPVHFAGTGSSSLASYRRLAEHSMESLDLALLEQGRKGSGIERLTVTSRIDPSAVEN